MATSIPTFKLDISEGMIDVDASADRLYGYCIEADKGPVMEPTFCASATEADRIFGVDFLPHFYQNPTGIVICRVEFDEMTKGKVEFEAYPFKTQEGHENEVDTEGTKFKVLKVESTSPGICNHRVVINKSSAGSGYNIAITIQDITAKKYQNVSSLERVVQKINDNFGKFLKAELTDAYKAQVYNEDGSIKKAFVRDQFVVPTGNDLLTYGYLVGGSNGKMRDGNGNPTETVITEELINAQPTSNMTAPNSEKTREISYRKAFEKIQEIDLIGIATIVDSQSVQYALADHINHVIEPEIHQLRFGITGYIGYKEIPTDGTTLAAADQTTSEKLQSQAAFLDNPWMIFMGQGVVFEDEQGRQRTLKPCETTQLYTGIRSALGYSEAIFGGESKKVLKGVVDVLPVVTDGSDITRELYEELNEHGVCTFKKEYGEVTFLEGVTTIQGRDVLSYENMMAIVAHVSKRLIKVAKPYQGRRLTEDLKSTLTTALLAELKNITETDGTLMELEDFNIPPYNVTVEAASKTEWDDIGANLIRVSKIIIKAKIVPVGALRDIDLGVIAI